MRARCGEWCDRVGAQLALRNKCDMHIGLDQNGNPYLSHAISTRGHTFVPSAYVVVSNGTVHASIVGPQAHAHTRAAKMVHPAHDAPQAVAGASGSDSAWPAASMATPSARLTVCPLCRCG